MLKNYKRVLQSITVADIGLFLVIVAWLIVSIGFALHAHGPVGSDWAEHVRIATEYSQGKFALFDSYIISVNGVPYPPLFHLLLAAAMSLHALYFFGIVLQILFLPLVFFLVAYLLRKYFGSIGALAGVLFLSSSIAFIDRLQVSPQGIDMILLPLIILSLLAKSWRTCGLLIAISIWTHGGYGMCIYLGVFVLAFHKSLRKTVFRTIIIATILASPIFLLFVWYLPTLLSSSLGVNSIQEQVVSQNVFLGLHYLSWALFVAFLVAFFVWFVEFRRTKHRGSDVLVVALGLIAGFFGLLLWYPDRFMSYVALPMSVFVGGILSLLWNRRSLRLIVILLMLLALLFAIVNNYLMWIHLLIDSGPAQLQVPQLPNIQ